jgi:hypothetical protein
MLKSNQEPNGSETREKQMQTINIAPSIEATERIFHLFAQNILQNIRETEDEDGQILWGKKQATSLLVGLLDIFKSLPKENQENIIKKLEQ